MAGSPSHAAEAAPAGGAGDYRVASRLHKEIRCMRRPPSRPHPQPVLTAHAPPCTPIHPRFTHPTQVDVPTHSHPVSPTHTQPSYPTNVPGLQTSTLPSTTLTNSSPRPPAPARPHPLDSPYAPSHAPSTRTLTPSTYTSPHAHTRPPASSPILIHTHPTIPNTNPNALPQP